MLIRGRLSTKAIPVLIGIGLFPAACAVTSDHSPPAYEYNDPIYSSVNFDTGGWSGWGSWSGWRGHSVAGHADFGEHN